jgi:hypothetical protein
MGRTLVSVLFGADLARPLSACSAGAWLGALALFGVMGCTDHVPYTTDADTGSTHAFISVERSRAGEVERAGALAGFAQMPATVDSAAVLSLVGWALELPPLGQCAARSRERDPSTPLSPIDHVEFLDAGEVKLETAGTGTTLAPHAFPTVTDLISGVVYTSRDRSSGALPAGTRYVVRTSGGHGVGPLLVSSEAPPSLGDVTAGGASLGSLDTVSAGRRLELIWKPGTRWWSKPLASAPRPGPGAPSATRTAAAPFPRGPSPPAATASSECIAFGPFRSRRRASTGASCGSISRSPGT